MVNKNLCLRGGLSVFCVLFWVSWAGAQTQAPVREISRLAGEVYRFRNNNHYSVFAVTSDGIIATDPINADAAKWLKAELQQRFGRPVKYLIYSHDHADHIAGGEVFADTAMVIAHDNAKAAIVGEKRPTAVPHITFAERLTIELGGTVLELSYVGRNHSNNSLVMRFPKERLLFAVDFIPVESLAFRDFPDAYIEEWIESLQRVEQMDFDVLVPGHGALGRKANVTMFREYLQDLHREVLKYAREGKSLEEMQQLIKLPKYEKWFGYQADNPATHWWPLNIAGMYREVQNHRRPN
jgi:glyoxylase-like metal-dependent hydrolase (beta-lactamase superfamily II)